MFLRFIQGEGKKFEAVKGICLVGWVGGAIPMSCKDKEAKQIPDRFYPVWDVSKDEGA